MAASTPIPALVPDLPAFLEDAVDRGGADAGQVVAPATPAAHHRGVCVCLLPSDADAGALALEGGEPAAELHMTLVMCGKVAEQPPEVLPALFDAMARLAARTPRMSAAITGITRFEDVGTAADPASPSGERLLSTDAIVLALSSPELDALRADVHASVVELGGVPSDKYGFNPHITLRYCFAGAPAGLDRAPQRSVLFDRLAVWAGDRRASYALQEPRPAEDTMTTNTSTLDTAKMTDLAASLDLPGAPLPTVALTAATPEPIAPGHAPPIALTAADLHARVTADVQAAGGRVVPFDAGPDGATMVGDHTDWNLAHTTGRLRAWASTNGTGDYDSLDEAKLSAAYAWWAPESGARKNLNAFKLPHHDVHEGRLVVSRPGLRAAARALMAGDTGIPEEDIPSVKLHLAQHFTQIGEDAPWTARHANPVELGGGLAVKLTAPSAGGTTPGVVSESWIQVARVGTFAGHSSGGFTFDADVFERIIANFLATANRRVPVDYEHATELLNDSTLQNGAPAVGWIVELANRGDAGLWGRVQWVDPTAVDYIRTGRYRFFSPAVAFNAIDPVTAQPIGPMLVSGGLTNRPFLDGMEPVTARGTNANVATASAPAADVPVAPPLSDPAGAFIAKVKAEATTLASAVLTGTRLTPEAARVYRFAAALVLTPEEALRWTSTVLDTRTMRAPGPAKLRALPFEDLPLGRAEAWNGDAAVTRVVAWATDEDGALDYADVSRAFAWVDPDNAETISAFKLPHHDVEGGDLVTVRRGVESAMAALNGARGGVDIPAEDRAKVYKHLAAHYALWDGTPPDLVVGLSATAEGGVARMSVAGSTVTENATAGTSTDVQVNVAPAPTSTPAAEPSTAAPVLARSERFAAAMSAAWDSPAASMRTLRDLTAVWSEGAEEAEELAESLRWYLGLPRGTTAAALLAQIERLSGYVRGDMGVADGVPAREIVSSLRCMMNLPVLSTASEVVDAVLALLRKHPAFAPAEGLGTSLSAATSENAAPVTASVGPEDVHVPGAMKTLTTSTTSENEDMNLANLSALCGLPENAPLTDIEAAVSARFAAEKTLRDSHTKLAQLHAETTVDGLIAAGRLSAAGRDAAVKLSMRDPEGANALFATLPTPVKAELLSTEGAPPAAQVRAGAPVGAAITAANREGAAAMSAQNTQATPAHAPPAAAHAQGAEPAADRSSVVHSKAVELMSADKALTYRAALEQADKATPRG